MILSATIKPAEACEIGAVMQGSGIYLIDTPVSGGYPGAQGGTLTMMATAYNVILDKFAPVMHAVLATIYQVGTKPGDGQVVKAYLNDGPVPLFLGWWVCYAWGAMYPGRNAARRRVSNCQKRLVTTTSSDLSTCQSRDKPAARGRQ